MKRLGLLVLFILCLIPSTYALDSSYFLRLGVYDQQVFDTTQQYSFLNTTVLIKNHIIPYFVWHTVNTSQDVGINFNDVPAGRELDATYRVAGYATENYYLFFDTNIQTCDPNTQATCDLNTDGWHTLCQQGFLPGDPAFSIPDNYIYYCTATKTSNGNTFNFVYDDNHYVWGKHVTFVEGLYPNTGSSTLFLRTGTYDKVLQETTGEWDFLFGSVTIARPGDTQIRILNDSIDGGVNFEHVTLSAEYDATHTALGFGAEERTLYFDAGIRSCNPNTESECNVASNGWATHCEQAYLPGDSFYDIPENYFFQCNATQTATGAIFPFFYDDNHHFHGEHVGYIQGVYSNAYLSCADPDNTTRFAVFDDFTFTPEVQDSLLTAKTTTGLYYIDPSQTIFRGDRCIETTSDPHYGGFEQGELGDLVEYWCQLDGIVNHVNVDCSDQFGDDFVCSKGACVETQPRSEYRVRVGVFDQQIYDEEAQYQFINATINIGAQEKTVNTNVDVGVNFTGVPSGVALSTAYTAQDYIEEAYPVFFDPLLSKCTLQNTETCILEAQDPNLVNAIQDYLLTHVGDPSASDIEQFDLNNDGRIDIADLVTAQNQSRWTTSCMRVILPWQGGNPATITFYNCTATNGVASHTFVYDDNHPIEGEHITYVEGLEQEDKDFLGIIAEADPSEGIAPLEVNFTCEAQGGNAPISYAWTFGDGATSSLQNPSHTYMAVGDYTATCAANDRDDDSIATTVDVAVLSEDLSPSAIISAQPQSGFAPVTSVIRCEGNPGDAPATYTITFGDGSAPVDNDFSFSTAHTYDAAGEYNATCTVEDSDGDTAFDSLIITVAGDHKPIAELTASPTSGDAPLNVSLECTGSNGDAPLTFRLEFGDAAAPIQSTQPIQKNHVYEAGEFTATCKVTDNDGDIAEDSENISVSAFAICGDGIVAGNEQCDDGNTENGDGCSSMCLLESPTLHFSATPTQGFAPLTVTFTCLGSGGTAPLEFLLDYGDGSPVVISDQGGIIGHTYASGIFTATCTVEDSQGQNDSASVVIKAIGPISCVDHDNTQLNANFTRVADRDPSLLIASFTQGRAYNTTNQIITRSDRCIEANDPHLNEPNAQIGHLVEYRCIPFGREFGAVTHSNVNCADHFGAGSFCYRGACVVPATPPVEPPEPKPISSSRRGLIIDQIAFVNAKGKSGERAQAGEAIEFALTLRNADKFDINNLVVTVVIDELDIHRKIGPMELEDGERVNLRTVLDLPEWADPGEYDVRIYITDERLHRIKHRPLIIVD